MVVQNSISLATWPNELHKQTTSDGTSHDIAKTHVHIIISTVTQRKIVSINYANLCVERPMLRY